MRKDIAQLVYAFETTSIKGDNWGYRAPSSFIVMNKKLWISMVVDTKNGSSLVYTLNR